MPEALIKYGSRKFIVAMTAIVLSYLLRLDNLITGEELVRLFIYAMGLYGAANVAQKVWVPEVTK